MSCIRVHMANGDYWILQEPIEIADSLINWYKRGFTRRGRLRHGLFTMKFRSPQGAAKFIIINRAQITSIEIEVSETEAWDEVNLALLRTAGIG